MDLDLDFSFSDKDSQFQIIKQARTAAGNDGDCYSQSKCCSPANLRIKVFFSSYKHDITSQENPCEMVTLKKDQFYI